MRDNFITDFRSREERHYCAILFAWLIESEHNMEAFLRRLNEHPFENLDFSDYKIYYEFTGIRELIFDEKREEAKKH